MNKNLEFQEKSHSYYLNKKRIPSVTQILAPISKVLYENIEIATLRNKAKIGTKVHRLIELHSKFGLFPSEEEDEDILKYFNQYLEWLKTLENSYIFENEFKGFYSSNELVFGGTIDNIRMIGNSLVLIDYKTVANPNDLILSLQLFGYKLIAEQTLGIVINEFKALCLRKDGFEYVDLTNLVLNKKTEELFVKLYELTQILDFHGIRNEAKKYSEENF